MFSVAFEDYNAVLAVLIALPKNIQLAEVLGGFVQAFPFAWSLFLLIFAYNKWRLMLALRLGSLMF
jgi:hypothetical protein